MVSLLNYWGLWDGKDELDERKLYRALQTTHDGTKSQGLLDAAKAFGFAEIRYETDMTLARLKRLSEEGYTVILNIQGGGKDKSDDWTEEFDDGHYVCLVAVKPDGVVVMDPYVGRYGKIPSKEFMDRWHDWNDEGDKIEYGPAIVLKGKKPLIERADDYAALAKE